MLVPARRRPLIVGALRSLRHRGDAVECNCCGGCFDRFIAHNERQFAKCPRCGSLERHRLLLVFLQTRTALFSRPLSILHVAPEYGLQAKLRGRPHAEYVSVDLDSPFASEHADVLALPYCDARFELVICNHVLEHVSDDRRALREIHRVLRPGGSAILMSPIDESRADTLEDWSVSSPLDRSRVFGQSDHVRRYGRDFADRVTGQGFEVQTVRMLDEVDSGQATRLGLRRVSGLFQRDDIFHCVRSG